MSWALRCMRYCFFSYFSKPGPPRLPRPLEERGRMAERRAFLWLKNMGIDVKRAGNRELHVRLTHNGRMEEFTLTGRADYLAENAVVEVKAGRPRTSYIPAYLAQLNLYMLMYGIDQGLLLFGDGTFLRVRRSDFVIRQSLSYFSELAGCIEDFRVPEGDSAFCASCPYRVL